MKSKSLIFRLVFALLSLAMIFSPSSSKPINNTVNGYDTQTISRVMLSQTQNAQRELKGRFPNYVRFLESCTGYNFQSEPTIRVKPEPGGGARYFPDNGGSIIFDYDSVVITQEVDTQNVDPRYLLQSETTLAEEKAKALHELNHDREAELRRNDGSLMSDVEISLEEGRTILIENHCMMNGNAEELTYAESLHLAYINAYKPAMDIVSKSDRRTVNGSWAYGRVLIVVVGVEHITSVKHVLGYHAVYQYVKNRVAQGVDWLVAVEESKYTGLDIFK